MTKKDKNMSALPTPTIKEPKSSTTFSSEVVTSPIAAQNIVSDTLEDGTGESDDEELELLPRSNLGRGSSTVLTSEMHEYTTAPLLTRGSLKGVGFNWKTQYGVLGEIINIYSKERTSSLEDSRLYINTNAPLSALVCGVQGSGKSHTVSTMLESMFICDDRRIGSLVKPLSGLVLHMSDGGPTSCPNEAAWIGISEDDFAKVPTVKVYVAPSSLQTMRDVYRKLGETIEVEPLYFTEDELDAQAFLSMMAVGSSDSAPLYVQIILSILRELGENYTYRAFRQKLDEKRKDFNPAQETGLVQRLALLESFMSKDESRTKGENRFKAGQLTIIDLSDPFIDPASACGIFECIIRVFVRAEADTGKIILVDEAHKYLSSSKGAAGLTKALLTLIREQRHKGMRIIISTQEPTVVPPVLIDLCSTIVLHRFSSPSWWEHVIRHVSADATTAAFDLLVRLKTGEAIVFSPSGICTEISDVEGNRVIMQYGRRYLYVRVRQRITKDGGQSVQVL